MFSLLLALFLSSIGNVPVEDELKDLMNRIKKLDPDLYALAQNESSGGINMAHSEVSRGLNKGTKAGGPWGMMPLTAKEVVGRSDAFKESYPDITQLSPEQVSHVLNYDPETAYALARAEYERRLQALEGDKQKAAYSWLHGVTGAKKASPEQIIGSEYVQKFLKNLPPNQAELQEED